MKGIHLERRWLFDPENSAQSGQYLTKDQSIYIRDLKHYDCPKYDKMDHTLIPKLMDLVRDDPWIKEFIRDEYTELKKKTNLHVSLFECLLFGNFLINNYSKKQF